MIHDIRAVESSGLHFPRVFLGGTIEDDIKVVIGTNIRAKTKLSVRVDVVEQWESLHFHGGSKSSY